MRFAKEGESLKKSYYAIIPANVRYDKNLTNGAKLLYGEITALCNQEGYCWASNSYFAELYQVSNVTISKWVSQLAKNGYISTQINYKNGTKQILNRYIRIVNDPIKENFNTSQRKLNDPIKENFKDNNTVNNTFNNTDEYIYTLFNYWNEQNIIKHRKMNQAMKSHINARLKEYSFEELKKAISNYAEILKSDEYYWTHKWSLQDFMKPNNVTRFVDEADPFNNFKKDKPSNGQRLIKEIDF